MRHFCQQVFGDFVVGNSTNSYTAPEFEELMARADRLSIQAIADQVTSNPSLVVQVEHGSDGRNWVSKSVSAELTSSLSSTITNVCTGFEPGTNPSHGRIRLRIALSGGTSPVANVKVYVTGRDRVP